MIDNKNIDEKTVQGFGDEWRRMDQRTMSDEEHGTIFDDYFRIFPWGSLPPAAIGADIGCGSGRWAKLVAPRVGGLHLVDASEVALNVAKESLQGQANATFHHASVGDLPFEDASLDFAYSLGVLHHVPDTAGALRSIYQKLKPGAPFLVYLYYAFDNRPWWFRVLWRMSDLVRQLVCRLPHALRYILTQMLALAIYWPLARLASVAERCGAAVQNWPLNYYRDKSFFVMRTDALDRFGTRLEQRFTRDEIQKMLMAAGFEGVHFSESTPFWCAIARRPGREG